MRSNLDCDVTLTYPESLHRGERAHGPHCSILVFRVFEDFRIRRRFAARLTSAGVSKTEWLNESVAAETPRRVLLSNEANLSCSRISF